MPQLSKGGKYIFGWTKIKENGEIIIPEEIVRKYDLDLEKNLILITGSKTSGGFCVSSRALLIKSGIAELLITNPRLLDFSIAEESPIKIKGRSYLWIRFRCNNTIRLKKETMNFLGIKEGDFLLAIKGSNLSSVFAVKGPIVEKARGYPNIKVFEQA
ncbi:MAG: hypothetical protein GX274_03560 [Clostridiales bacterium]|jgi:bifunctional DNA-binding transcriptional regulator/antitoxin component of YhaV-PrlF toxin-antitoxin module|nr:hypothetical protein [Clostridiales bacterium]